MSDKLDRLVATKVMGIRISEGTECGRCSGMGEYPQSGPGREGRRTRPTMKPCPGCHGLKRIGIVGPASYSTSILAAWEVVRNLRARKVEPYDDPWTFQIVDSFTTDGRKWSASVGTVGFRFSHGGEHEDECMAICLAALRAVGVPESEIQEAMR